MTFIQRYGKNSPIIAFDFFKEKLFYIKMSL
jgi:hypothetical protein